MRNNFFFLCKKQLKHYIMQQLKQRLTKMGEKLVTHNQEGKKIIIIGRYMHFFSRHEHAYLY